MSWKNILEQCLYPVHVDIVHPGSSRLLVKGHVISHLSKFFFLHQNFLRRSVAAVHPGGDGASGTARELWQDPLESHEVSGRGERGEVHN